MPSAAKRRKAAKKKREKEANNNNASSTTTNNRSHGTLLWPIYPFSLSPIMFSPFRSIY
ncbi:hypothetical protein SLEP1_g7807 [Rubroshorea leprosula]|uniref:Uncharacterized protein n=1 Tax=Rubroshorea leprosula TaxID=152421 RepID=A0AAV5I7X8_9ROSI|nr:hypothetical protein SLEP1_g7807 [Rubroshorea leprosula]